MAKRRARRAESADAHGLVTVVACRGGDCGSRRKHPGVDHAGQLQALRDGAGAGAVVVPSKCLDACEHSNVVVVMPGAEGVEAGAAPVWIGEANDPAVTADIVEWVRAGGPGVAPAPTLVAIQEFRPTRQSRQELAPGHALP
ncbi:(2Fe-2S) ferredoxin domain-containing protein [Agrococcus sp. HG114]|uniref:(2Fe-2S) ferredoxin domain-containing protein n=1 Tax=Agrococcus sp. HG114 TaxID=2969757 RepID=UPI00215B656F|nr:(2Fe-2S) ferredoxin domain-containing protein [Agrococcus sp. HG114]MCR8670096.1 (2Fe-2S) ferredoxin domain-containing protein [Agrococcus sp. HG114]